VTSLLLAVLLFGRIELGGQIAGVYPVAGLDRFHSSSALLGAGIACASGPIRVELGYRYAGLPGIQNNPYRLSLHQVMFEGAYSFLRRGNWGIEAVTGAGFALASRSYHSGLESGTVGSGQLGCGFYQYAGNSRLSAGLVHTLFFEKGGSGSPAVAVSQMLALRAGVAYAF